MDNENLEKKILTILPDAVLDKNSQHLTITVVNEKLHTLAQQLKEDDETAFDYLFCLYGVDYGDNLAVVYHLESTKYRHAIILKTLTPNRENPQIDSVYDIWKAAEYHENEVYDLLGIKFKNHK